MEKLNKSQGEKTFENEQPLHLIYMKSFLVNKCENDCKSEECIKYHSHQSYRRRPYMNFDGTWNYTPKMCKNPQPCRLADRCRYAHTKEECSYHPLIYKVNNCKFNSLDTGKCSKWGYHCSFAHLEPDKRIKGIVQKAPVVFSCETYKTELCENKACKSDDCIKYHDAFEKRRNFNEYNYLSVPCNFTYKDSNFLSPENCPNKDLCELAHTKNEVYYHKTMYKTKNCRNIPCYSKFCAFLHPGEYIGDIVEEKIVNNEQEIHRNDKEVYSTEKKNYDDEKGANTIDIHHLETIESKPSTGDVSVRDNGVKDEEIKDKTPENHYIPDKLRCKMCREREIKWVFDCGLLSCSKCIEKECSKCNRKHITRLNF
jgi:hypothetical protein